MTHAVSSNGEDNCPLYLAYNLKDIDASYIDVEEVFHHIAICHPI
jgi:hypothetical protein